MCVCLCVCSLNRVFIDADKKKYQNYLLELMGYELIKTEKEKLIPNETSTSETSTSSLNNKKYMKTKVSLLNKNALIIIDNTLWKGLVLNEVTY